VVQRLRLIASDVGVERLDLVVVSSRRVVVHFVPDLPRDSASQIVNSACGLLKKNQFVVVSGNPRV
jgi:septum formation inhibitor-activating ATPase MinD